MPIHPFEAQALLKPFSMPTPFENQGALQKIQNMAGANLLQQQELAQNQDAATQRQAAIAKQRQLQQILLSPGAIGPDGTPTDEALVAISKVDPDHAGALLKAFGKDPNTLSEINLRNSQVENMKQNNTRADIQAADKQYYDKQEAERKAGLPIEVSPGATLHYPAGKGTDYTAPAVAKPDTSVTPFEAWQKQNPGKPVSEWLKLEASSKPATGTAAGIDAGASLDDFTETMKSGRGYINVAKLTGKDKNALVAAAAKAGVPTVDAAGADALSNIDTARDNLQKMNDTLAPYLAEGGGGRLYTGPRNTIESYFQIDPALSSVGTYRNAAIQAMRSVAGAKGLRINQAEIQMAIDNDIPKLTDTAPVAKAKMQQMLNFLDNAEQGLLVKNRANPGAPPPSASAAGKAPAGVDPAVWNVMTPQERALWSK